jgi:predicted MFS family arabinose efflux permease
MRPFQPLTVRAFRRLATTYALNELAWGFGTIALAVLVYDRTGSAAATTLLFLSTTFLPALLAPALTSRLDRLPVRRALPALYTGEAALFASLSLLSGRFLLPVVLALALADGLLAIVGRALTRAAVAAAVKPVGGLEAANKLLNVVFSVALAVGPALGGLVVAAGGAGVSLAVAAGLFGLMALALVSCRTLPPAPEAGVDSWRDRLQSGLRYVLAHRAVRRLLTAHAATIIVVAAVVPIEIVYVKDSLGSGDAAYGLLLAAWGAGTVLSSLALMRARSAASLALIPWAAATTGAGYALMALAPSVPVAVLGCLVGGAGNGIYYVCVVQAVQERVADEFQARVMGLLESVNAGFLGVGFVLGGLVTSLADPRTAIAMSAIGALLSAGAIRAVARAERGARRAEHPLPAAQPTPAG